MLYSFVLYCIVLDWIGLYWIGLNWIGLNWIELDWIVLHYIVFNSKSSPFEYCKPTSHYSSYVFPSQQSSCIFLPRHFILVYFISAFFSYIFLGEKFGPQGYFGTALILAGVWYSANGGNKNEIEKVEEKQLILLNQNSILNKEKTEN